MQNIVSTQNVRSRFLKYFKERGHTIAPSSPTVPRKDPTLLFINAGMNQFKEVFLGQAAPTDSKLVSAQKCIRVGGKHNDLENVGHTKRHLTFFEMLGNFSFGDYFKKTAITLAFEAATSIFNFPEEKLFVSVYEQDEEAYQLWKKFIDEKKISRMGSKNNFWSMGETGPCGPCSELFFDRGPRYGSAQAVHEDTKGVRFLEFWNLVFMECNRDSDGAMTPLPKQSVDTGAGLERVLMLMMNGSSVFETDVLRMLIEQIEVISGQKYDSDDPHKAPAFRVIADHIRSLAFAIADGAHPGNTERGYVLRKILRRAVRYGRLLGLRQPFLAQVVPSLVQIMGEDFDELRAANSRIQEILYAEEESFLQTLERGSSLLNRIIDRETSSDQKEISGHEAFKLKDTYGFPIEEILLIAKDANLTVDLDKYQILEEQAKELSRQSRKKQVQQVESSIYEDFSSQKGATKFIGYQKSKEKATVTGLIVNGKRVDAMNQGEEGVVLLDRTPFYAEQGGQVGDVGMLTHATARFKVTDCQSPYQKIIAHVGSLERGTLTIGEPMVAEIDANRRLSISKHHTTTHLLHYALQQVLGPEIRQAGSLVQSKRLRFDFNYHRALTKEEIRKVEWFVCEKIWANSEVKTYEVPFEEVRKNAEIKQFFGEKYGKRVRVVDIDHYSKELCGGTHVEHLGAIGTFRIAKEASIAKGVRRIEGVIGACAEQLRYQTEDQIMKVAKTLRSTPSKLDEVAQSLIEENELLKKQVTQSRKKELVHMARCLTKKIEQIGQVALLTAAVEVSQKEMVELGHDLIERLTSGVVLLGRSESNHCHLLLRISPDLVERGIHANTFIKVLAREIKGSGGGKKEIAHAGGKCLEGMTTAFDKMKKLLAT